MDQPSEEKVESSDTIQDEGINYHDKFPTEITETLACEQENDFNDVQSNNKEILEDQDISQELSHSGEKHVAEETDIQIVSTDNETEKNQDTEMSTTSGGKYVAEETDIQIVSTDSETEKNQDTEMSTTSGGKYVAEETDIQIVSTDSETEKNQDTEMSTTSGGKYVAEETDIQIVSTDSETEKNQDTEMNTTEKENVQAIETKIIEELNTEKTQILSHESQDSCGKSISDIMKHDRIKETEDICSVGSSTNTNTVIIDLCDDDGIEICEEIDGTNVLDSSIDLRSNNECDSTSKITQEIMEYKYGKEEENVTASDSKPLNTIIIDLCDDQVEIYEQNDGGIQSDRRLDFLEKDGETFSEEIPRGLMSNAIDIEGKIRPIHIFKTTIHDDSDKETQTKAITLEDNTKVESKTSETTQREKSKEACELSGEDLPEEPYQTTGVDLYETPCKIILKGPTKGVDPHHSDTEKNDSLAGSYENVRRCFEAESVKLEESHEASITDKSDDTETKKENDECDIENFRFKDDIITLQEDYGMDSKQVNKDSFHYLVKSDMASEDCKFTTLDVSNGEEKRYDKSEKILGCEYENISGPNAIISEIIQTDSKVEEQEITCKLKTDETKNKENIEHGQALKLELNEQENIDLIKIKKEIEEDLKRLGGKESTQSATEKDQHSSTQTEKISEQGQQKDIAMPLTFTNFLAKVINNRVSDNINQQTESPKNELQKVKNDVNISDAEIAGLCNKKVISEVCLDITRLKENDHNVKSIPKGILGLSIKDRNSKSCQTENKKDANENSAGVYLNETPPSNSDSNEEFYDAVEYIPEAIATKETHPIKKDEGTLLSTPIMNSIDEPIPGPSGVSTKKNEDQTSDEILKTKESRKHNDIEEDDENENQKKIKLD